MNLKASSKSGNTSNSSIPKPNIDGGWLRGPFQRRQFPNTIQGTLPIGDLLFILVLETFDLVKGHPNDVSIRRDRPYIESLIERPPNALA